MEDLAEKKTCFEMEIVIHHQQAQLMNFARDVYKLLSHPDLKQHRSGCFTDYVRMMNCAERYKECPKQRFPDYDFKREDDWEIAITQFADMRRQLGFTVRQLNKALDNKFSYKSAPHILHGIIRSLVKRGVLTKIKHGVYRITEAGVILIEGVDDTNKKEGAAR